MSSFDDILADQADALAGLAGLLNLDAGSQSACRALDETNGVLGLTELLDINSGAAQLADEAGLALSAPSDYDSVDESTSERFARCDGEQVFSDPSLAFGNLTWVGESNESAVAHIVNSLLTASAYASILAPRLDAQVAHFGFVTDDREADPDLKIAACLIPYAQQDIDVVREALSGRRETCDFILDKLNEAIAWLFAARNALVRWRHRAVGDSHRAVGDSRRRPLVTTIDEIATDLTGMAVVLRSLHGPVRRLFDRSSDFAHDDLPTVQ